MKKCRRAFLLVTVFVFLSVQCASAECNNENSNGIAPDTTWMKRIEDGLEKRRSLLRELSAGEDIAIEMNYFSMGRHMNFFVAVGVTSNKMTVVAQRDVCSNIVLNRNQDITATNLAVNVSEDLLHELRDGLRKYRYYQHAGSRAGWVRVSVNEDGQEVVRWFDRPGWPRSEDRNVLRGPLFSRRSDNEEVWRRFLGVYRTISFKVSDFLKDLDQNLWLQHQRQRD